MWLETSVPLLAHTTGNKQLYNTSKELVTTAFGIMAITTLPLGIIRLID